MSFARSIFSAISSFWTQNHQSLQIELGVESSLSPCDIYLESTKWFQFEKNFKIQIWLINETREFSQSSGALASSKQELKHSFTCGQHRKGEPFTVNASLMQSNHLFQRQNSSKKP